MVTVDDSTVVLECEMRAYIRPDSSLIWEGPGGRRIAGGTGKYQITFSDGSQDAAANGGVELVPSRVSTLTITNPEPSDAGTYTCSVMGTTEAVTMELTVNGSAPQSTSTSKYTLLRIKLHAVMSHTYDIVENSVSQLSHTTLCISITVCTTYLIPSVCIDSPDNNCSTLCL